MFCKVSKKKKEVTKKKTFNEDLTELVYSRIAEDSPKGKEDPHFHCRFYHCTSSFEIVRVPGPIGRPCHVLRHRFRDLQMDSRTK